MHNLVPKRGSKLLNKFCWKAIVGTPIVASLLSLTAPTQAQTAPPLFQNVTISPYSSQTPATIRGISGGSVPATKVAGRTETATGPCTGFTDEKPDHTLVLTSFFKNLSIEVESPEDTTIVVSGPGGTWCNDDHHGKNPGLSGQWLAGSYGIWVGSYEKNKYIPYVIRIQAK